MYVDVLIQTILFVVSTEAENLGMFVFALGMGHENKSLHSHSDWSYKYSGSC